MIEIVMMNRQGPSCPQEASGDEAPLPRKPFGTGAEKLKGGKNRVYSNNSGRLRHRISTYSLAFFVNASSPFGLYTSLVPPS